MWQERLAVERTKVLLSVVNGRSSDDRSEGVPVPHVVDWTHDESLQYHGKIFYNMFNVWKLRRCFFPPNFTFFFWGTLCPREIPVPWWWMVWMERLTLKSNKKRPQISRILRTPWVPQILCWYMLTKSITFAAIIDTSHWMSLTRKFLRFSRNSKTQSFWHPGSTNQKGWKWTMVPLSWTIWWKSGVADKAFNLSRDSLGNFANVETWDYGNYRSVRVRILKVLTVWLYFDCGSGLTKEDILDSVNAHMFQDSNTRALRYSVTDSWPRKVIPLNAQDSSVRCAKPCVP